MGKGHETSFFTFRLQREKNPSPSLSGKAEPPPLMAWLLGHEGEGSPKLLTAWTRWGSSQPVAQHGNHSQPSSGAEILHLNSSATNPIFRGPSKILTLSVPRWNLQKSILSQVRGRKVKTPREHNMETLRSVKKAEPGWEEDKEMSCWDWNSFVKSWWWTKLNIPVMYEMVWGNGPRRHLCGGR